MADCVGCNEYDILCTHLCFFVVGVTCSMNPNALLSPYVFAFTNNNTVPGRGKKSKEIASTAFTKTFRIDEFSGGVVDGSIGGKLGSHSI